ncbi:hypothetical protein U5U50_02110 [Mycoplasma sp. 888]|uniref:hypothetical protein n=1 Tax=Mycoplasma sp. 888 TaxID=3108483 RepID=UPI002D76F87D|nr:hypothetical protein [Mycoplasma sp. 888]WRQ25586.1 hypothetical protein U5U50_02110 [Mycoplasma sp. 888]
MTNNNQNQDWRIFQEKKLKIDPSDIIADIKKKEILSQLINDLNISDKEIWDYFIHLIDYYKQRTVDINDPIKNYFYRDEEGKLQLVRKIVNNDKGKKLRLENHLIFTDISEPINNEVIENVTINDEVYIDLHAYIEDLKIKLKEHNELSMQGLLICGTRKSQRSNLLSRIANSFALDNNTVAYININDLDQEIKKTFDKKNSSDIDFIKKQLSEVDLLILDEIGLKNLSIWFWDSIIMDILEERSINKKITFFGTYFTSEKIFSHLKEINEKSKSSTRLTEQMLIKIIEVMRELIFKEILIG